MKFFFLKGAAIIFFAASFFSACTKQQGAEPSRPLSEIGRQVYQANCIACHNSDPAKDGSVGPSVSGSSLELLSARVLHASYPPGYKPKRSSGAMPAMPHLKDKLDALHAYLNGR